MATIRDNEFDLSMTGMSEMTFTIKDHNIHSGQPWKGISKIDSDSSGTCKIHVMAGRKGSEGTAKWFKEKVAGGSAAGCSTTDLMPKELNFAFIGDMTFKHGGKTYTGTDIVIGQGHFGAQNNWWVGGKNMSGITVPVLGGVIAQNFTIAGALVPICKTFFAASVPDHRMDMGIVEL